MEILRRIEILRCLSKNRVDTNMLRIHVFSIFSIKTPRTLATLAPLGILIVKTLTIPYTDELQTMLRLTFKWFVTNTHHN